MVKMEEDDDEDENVPDVSQKRMTTRRSRASLDECALRDMVLRPVHEAKAGGIAANTVIRLFEESIREVYRMDVNVQDGGSDLCGEGSEEGAGRKRRASKLYTCSTCLKTFTRKFNLKVSDRRVL